MGLKLQAGEISSVKGVRTSLTYTSAALQFACGTRITAKGCWYWTTHF